MNGPPLKRARFFRYQGVAMATAEYRFHPNPGGSPFVAVDRIVLDDGFEMGVSVNQLQELTSWLISRETQGEAYRAWVEMFGEAVRG